MGATAELINHDTIAVFNDSQHLTISVRDVELKIPNDGTVSDMHDATNSFLVDLLSIDGVSEVFEKHGIGIEKKV